MKSRQVKKIETERNGMKKRRKEKKEKIRKRIGEE